MAKIDARRRSTSKRVKPKYYYSNLNYCFRSIIPQQFHEPVFEFRPLRLQLELVHNYTLKTYKA